MGGSEYRNTANKIEPRITQKYYQSTDIAI